MCRILSYFSVRPKGKFVFFSVRDLELRKAVFDVTIEPGTIDFLDPKLRQTGPLKAQGVAELVSHSLDEIHILGRMSARMEADCDRCLEPAPFPVDAELDLIYAPAEEVGPGGEEKEIKPGDAEIAFYDGDGVSLEEVLREQILLSLPYKRICSEDCKGLCPVCGQSLNQQECHCDRQPVDERWSALRDIAKH